MLSNNKEISIYSGVCLIVFLACLIETSLYGAELLSIPSASIYLDEIDRKKYNVAKQLDGAVLIRWDFSDSNQYIYSFKKKSITCNLSKRSGNKSGKDVPEIILNAKLFVNSLGNQTADVVLKDVETVIRHWKDEDEQVETKIPIIPLIKLNSIDESGEKKSAEKYGDLFNELLFSLPNKPLEYKVPMVKDRSVPIAINNKVSNISGELKITLTDFVKIRGRTCARIEAVGDVNNYNEPNGSNKCAIKTSTVFYFDYENHCLLAGGSAGLISIRFKDTATGRKVVKDNHILFLINLKEQQ